MKKYAVIVYYTFGEPESEVICLIRKNRLVSIQNRCGIITMILHWKIQILMKKIVIVWKIMQSLCGKVLVREFLKQ